MDPKPCNTARHCSTTAKIAVQTVAGSKSYKAIYIGLSLIVAFAMLCTSIVVSKPLSKPVTTSSTPALAIAETASPQPSATLPAPTKAVILPPTGDEWTKIQPGVYARMVGNRSNCYLLGYGVEYCAGEPVEYYTTNGRWIVAWENSWSKTKKEIIPGEPTLIYIPSDATNIHWEWGQPGCDSLFLEECLGN